MAVLPGVVRNKDKWFAASTDTPALIAVLSDKDMIR